MKHFPITFLLLASALGTVIAEDAPAPVPPAPPKMDAPPAEGPEGGPRRGGGGGQNKAEMEAQWKKADLDGDGFLSEAEFALLPRIAYLPEEKRAAIFHRLDKNGDGKISPEEMRPNRPRQPAFPSFEEMDLNKDGKITFEEFKQVPFVARQPEERQHAMFDRMDRDKDGVITAKDGPPPGMRPEGGPGGRGRHFDPKKFIQEFDTNGDGALSFEEFRKAPFVKDLTEDAQEAKFNEMDKNKDQKIDMADFPAPPDHPPGPPMDDDDKDEHRRGPEKP